MLCAIIMCLLLSVPFFFLLRSSSSSPAPRLHFCFYKIFNEDFNCSPLLLCFTTLSWATFLKAAFCNPDLFFVIFPFCKKISCTDWWRECDCCDLCSVFSLQWQDRMSKLSCRLLPEAAQALSLLRCVWLSVGTCAHLICFPQKS